MTVPACLPMNSLQSLFATLFPSSLSSILLSFSPLPPQKRQGRTSQYKLESAYKRLDFVSFLPIFLSGDLLYSDHGSSFVGGTSRRFHLKFCLSLFHPTISLTKKGTCQGEHVRILTESIVCVSF